MDPLDTIGKIKADLLYASGLPYQEGVWVKPGWTQIVNVIREFGEYDHRSEEMTFVLSHTRDDGTWVYIAEDT